MGSRPNYVITISRQLGSGGAYIGQKLAEKLHISYLDREIIYQAASKLNTLVEELEGIEEKKQSAWHTFLGLCSYCNMDTYVPPGFILPTDKQIYEVERDIILNATRVQSAVIIGRAGAHILKDHPHHISIFLHADISFRQKRVQQVYHVTEQEALKMIVETDRSRSKYLQFICGQDLCNAKNYDLSLNTGLIGIEKAEKVITDLMIKMFGNDILMTA